MTIATSDTLLSTRQAAELVGMNQTALRIAILDGRLPRAGVTQHGHHLIDRNVLLRWAEEHPPRPPKSRQPWLATAAALVELGPATAIEIAAFRRIDPGNVRKHLLILDAQGVAERRSDGQWVLIASDATGAA